MNEEIRACRCTDFWAFHHPDCPAMQTIRRLRDELAECRLVLKDARSVINPNLSPQHAAWAKKIEDALAKGE